jgi:imidazolonepropionase-like amidohydrolase
VLPRDADADADADADVVELDEAMIRAIVEAARKHGLRVAEHAEGPRAIAAAIRGGAASIEHGALVDADSTRPRSSRRTSASARSHPASWPISSAFAAIRLPTSRCFATWSS